MNRPSARAMSEWYEKQPKGERTCSDCGKVGPYYYVQAQHPYYADGLEGVSRCSDCITKINQRITEKRKAQLALEPRCSLCNRRGTFVVAGSVLMCGAHLKKAQHKAQSFGWLAMTIGNDPETILSLARGGK